MSSGAVIARKGSPHHRSTARARTPDKSLTPWRRGFRQFSPVPQRPRVLTIILLLTFALAGFLTFEAWDATRQHRADAERTMRDYAGFAAWEYNSTLKDQIYTTLVWILGPVGGMEWMEPHQALSPASIIGPKLAAKQSCGGEVSTVFRVTADRGELTTDGPGLDTAMARWVRDTIMAEMHGG